jgi:protein-tyrosine-phosphatase
MKVLFICKHNRFRSRVATSYFNKINKIDRGKNIAKGAGIYPDNDPLDKNEVNISKSLGVDIKGKPRKVSQELLKWQDIIVIVADDVKKSQIKNYNKYKIIVWKVKDTDITNKKRIKMIVKEIIKRVDLFNRKMKREER